jgi:hypothetical protein
MDTSVEIGSETVGEEESRKGAGLNGGKESRQKNDDGCDKDREWVGPILKFWVLICWFAGLDTGIWEYGEMGGI